MKRNKSYSLANLQPYCELISAKQTANIPDSQKPQPNSPQNPQSKERLFKPPLPNKKPPTENDIKELYEYRIKERANRQKINREMSQQGSKPESNIEELNLRMTQIQKKNAELGELNDMLMRENRKLKEIVSVRAVSSKKQLKEPEIGKSKPNPSGKNFSGKSSQQTYKQQILNKMNQRHRLKTQLAAQEQKGCDSKSKGKLTKRNSSKSSHDFLKQSGNNITMNLNMSFLKVSDNKKDGYIKPHLTKASKDKKDSHLHHNKSLKTSKSMHKLKTESSVRGEESRNQQSLKKGSLIQIFKGYCQKQLVSVTDLRSFYQLNVKVFKEFQNLISCSKATYHVLSEKVTTQQQIQTLPSSKERFQNQKRDLVSELDGSSQKETQIQNLLNSIEGIYRLYSPSKSSIKQQFSKQNSSNKCKTQSISAESSVVGEFTVKDSNFEFCPETKQQNASYRLNKLNENLHLLSSYELKKEQMKEGSSEKPTQNSTEIKPYLSKPISMHASRKISFNNSLNNSLGNSRHQ